MSDRRKFSARTTSGKGRTMKISAPAKFDCQTTANHDRTGPITTDVVFKKTVNSGGFCFVGIDGDRPWNRVISQVPNSDLRRPTESHRTVIRKRQC